MASSLLPFTAPNFSLYYGGCEPGGKPFALEFQEGSNGQVAQLVEQWTENPCVGGSIPPLSTGNAGR